MPGLGAAEQLHTLLSPPGSRAPGPHTYQDTRRAPGLRGSLPAPAKAVTGPQEAGAEGDTEGQSQGS